VHPKYILALLYVILAVAMTVASRLAAAKRPAARPLSDLTLDSIEVVWLGENDT